MFVTSIRSPQATRCAMGHLTQLQAQTWIQIERRWANEKKSGIFWLTNHDEAGVVSSPLPALCDFYRSIDKRIVFKSISWQPSRVQRWWLKLIYVQLFRHCHTYEVVFHPRCFNNSSLWWYLSMMMMLDVLFLFRCRFFCLEGTFIEVLKCTTNAARQSRGRLNREGRRKFR